MSRIAAVQRRIEQIVTAVVPETALSAKRFTLVPFRERADDHDALRQVVVTPTGDLSWDNEFTQDREGLILREGFSIDIAYPAAVGKVQLDTVIRQDVIRIQYELLDPANWESSDWACQRRLVSGYSLSGTESSDELLVVRIPVTLIYRPF